MGEEIRERFAPALKSRSARCIPAGLVVTEGAWIESRGVADFAVRESRSETGVSECLYSLHLDLSF
jgi:hypothetical protein